MEQSQDKNKNLMQTLIEFGFKESHIQKAIQLTQNEDQAIELIVQFIEDEEQEEKIFEKIEFKEDKVKMVIVVRNDLKMKTGKIAAQVGHGVLGAYKQVIQSNKSRWMQCMNSWEDQGQMKIVVQISNEQSLVELVDLAISKDVNACLIRDAGHTQVAPGSITVAAFGPDVSSVLDQLTGQLKLL